MNRASSEPTPVRGMGRAPDGGVLAPFRALGRAYRGIEDSSMWGRLVLGNLWPAYLFALPLIGKLWTVLQRLAAGPGAEDPLHYQAQMAQDAVTLVFFALVVALYAIRAPVKGAHADFRGAVVALAGTFLLNLVGFLPVPGASPSTGTLLASTAVVLVGTGFTIWSLATLGRCFGMFPEARGLVTRGPYHWVRHPIYVGELISGLGFVITRPHPLVIGLYLLFFALQYWRTVLEDRALGAAFPAEYPAYQARTGRLVPGWR